MADSCWRQRGGGATWATVNNGLSWSSHGFTYVPAVRVLAIDPKNPDTLYAGTDEGVFRSVNGGESWKPIISGMPTRSVTSVAINPQDPNQVYAGTFGGLFEITFDRE